MAIPSSGPISMSMFNTELGRVSNTANSSLAGGSTPAVGSLFWLGNQSGSLNQTAPHAMSEWYGYEVTPSTTTTTTSTTTTTTTACISYEFTLRNDNSYDVSWSGYDCNGTYYSGTIYANSTGGTTCITSVTTDATIVSSNEC